MSSLTSSTPLAQFSTHLCHFLSLPNRGPILYTPKIPYRLRCIELSSPRIQNYVSIQPHGSLSPRSRWFFLSPLKSGAYHPLFSQEDAVLGRRLYTWCYDYRLSHRRRFDTEVSAGVFRYEAERRKRVWMAWAGLETWQVLVCVLSRRCYREGSLLWPGGWQRAWL